MNLTYRPALTGILVVVILAAAVLDVVPGWDVSVAVTALILGIAATGLNLMFGYTGMLSLGNAMFLGMAGFAMGITVVRYDWPIGFALIAAVGATAVVSYGMGALLVRVPGIYFAVVMLGLAIGFEGLVRAYPAVTGGASGLSIPGDLVVGPFRLDDEQQWFWFVGAVSGLVVLVAWSFTWGKTGRILRLIRTDELAASVLGVRIHTVKRATFALGATLTGLSGVLLFLWQRVFVPESMGLLRSVELVTIVVVGGLGSLYGGFAGAVVLTWIHELIRGRGESTELIYGIAFLVMVLYAPHGVIGLLRRVERKLVPTRHPRPAVRSVEERSVDMSVLRSRSVQTGLRVRSVTRMFGGVVAVNDVSIDVPPGSLIGLIGTNGAGKSTLMNLISGVERPNGGIITLDDEEIQGKSPAQIARLGVARTFQVPRLVNDLTVIENIALGGDPLEGSAFWKSRSGEQRTLHRAAAALDRAELSALGPRLAGTLGTGERKYVELVRALAWDPAVLLMDEPAVGLADGEVERLAVWLTELRDEGTAILLVDHNLDFVGELVSHVYMMEQGLITRSGTPDDVLGTGMQMPVAPSGLHYD